MTSGTPNAGYVTVWLWPNDLPWAMAYVRFEQIYEVA